MQTGIEQRDDLSVPALTSIVGAGRLLSVGRTKVYELIDGGELEVVNIGRRRLVVVASIHAYVERLREEPRQANGRRARRTRSRAS